MLQKCTNCNHEWENTTDANFCPACGNKLENEKSSFLVVNKCPQCNANISDDAKFCSSCGKVLDDSQDHLSAKGKIFTWVGVLLMPLGVVVIAIIYYSLRKNYPKKAAELNRHSFYAFGVAILLHILSRLI